ncbi:MAG: fibronectin type 3 domain-containing protein [Candidatus Latescibacterota bacterium]|jgi:fibronectin type 3 domain-containing protein
MIKQYIQLMALCAAALLLLSCDRERSNPIDPQAAVLVLRPDTPTGLQIQPGVGRILLGWQPVNEPDLAGYAIFRAAQSNGTYAFVSGDGDSTLQISTGKVSFIDSLDSPGATFFYRVAAVDTTGLLSELSNFVGATIIEDVVPPEPPLNLSAVADESDIGRIVVRWTLPRIDSNNGELTGLAGFVLFRAEGDQGYVPIDTLAADVQTYTDEGLKALTVYAYRILSFDAKGNDSQLTTPQQTSTLGLRTPGNVVATGEVGRIELNWNGVDNTDLLGYNIYRSMRSDEGYELLPSLEGSEFTTGQTTHIDSGLAGGERFFYKVQAIGRGNLVSEISVFVGATAVVDEVAPTAPGDISAVPDEVDFGRVVVSWNAPIRDADNSQLTGISTYTVYRSVDTNTSFVVAGNVDASQRQFADSGLEESTTYFYALTASDVAGNEGPRSGGVQVRTKGVDKTAPQSPQNISAIPDEVNFGRVVVRWNAPVTDSGGGELTGLVSFVLFRSKGGNSSFVPIDTLDVSVREYADANLEPLTSYSYTMSALDEAGNESARASAIQVRTEGPDQVAPVSPQNLSALADEVDFGRVTVSWGASTLDVGGGQLTGLANYTVFRSKGSTNSFQPVASLDANTRQLVDAGLEPLTTYFYTVIAVDDAGNESARATAVQVRTEGPDQVAPVAPQNLSAVADEVDFGQATVSWNASTQDIGGGQLTGLANYTIFRSKGSTNSFQPVASLDANTRQFIDTGLEESTTYFYTVTAVDDAGNESARASAVQVRTEGPDQVAPVAPQNLSAVADEAIFTQITVRWNASTLDVNGNQLTDLMGYIVFRSKGTTNSYVPVDTVDVDMREFVDASLEELTTYFYTVTAIDEAGNESVRSTAVQVRTEGPDRVSPAAPQNLSAVADELTFSQVVVSWNASSLDAGGGDLTGLTGYTVFRSKGSTNSFQPVASVDADTRQLVDTGLDELTTYFYTVTAVDEAGNESARASAVQVRTQGPDRVAPASPQNLSAVADEAIFGQITVRWNASTLDADGGQLTDLTGYILFRSKGTTNSFVPIDTVDANTRQFVDTGLEESTTYFYTVTAVDGSSNESGRASAVQVRTEGPDRVAPAPPQNLSAVADEVDFGQVSLSWNASTQDTGGGELTGLTGYIVFRSKGSTSSFVPIDTVATDTRQFIDTNLESSTNYFYTVTAIDVAGNQSARASFVSVQTNGPDQVAPEAPSDLVAVAASSVEEITVSWSPPTRDADGGDLTGLSSYVVLRSKDNSNSFAPIDTVTTENNRYVDTGLDASTTYFYALRAVDNSSNSSARSSSTSAKTAGIDSPSGISATAGIRKVTVSWTASSEESLIGYNIYRSTRSDQDFSRLTGVEGTSYSTGQTTYIDSNLTGGATFFYKISTVTSVSESSQSTFVGATVQSDNRAPSAPTLVDGESVTDDPEKINITWKAPTTDSNGSDLTGLESYLVYRATVSTGPFSLVGTVTATAFQDTGLAAVTTYFYQVEAVDQVGNVSSRSTTVSAITSGVDKPTNVRISASTPSDIATSPTVTVNWTASVGAILEYEVQRTAVANSTTDSDYTNVTPNSLSTTRTDTGVSRGTTYYYRLRARDVDDRVSDWTDPVQVDVAN